VAYDSGTGAVYVANQFSNNVSVISDTNNTVVATVTVGLDPHGVTYDAGTGEIFVADDRSDEVSVILDTNYSILASIGVGTNPWGLAYDRGTGEVFVANEGSDNVSAITDTNWTVVGSPVVGSQPYGVACDDGKQEVFVTNEASDNVSVLSSVYRVTFTESGLPNGTTWWVNASGGHSASSSNATLSFNASDGSYLYTVSTINRSYFAAGGSFVVDGGGVSETVDFSLVAYDLTFVESGLPAGTLWSVRLDGVLQNSTSSTVQFDEPNGSFSFSVTSLARYLPDLPNGTVTVNGAARSVDVGYFEVYEVAFTETGLPVGTNWSVVLTIGPVQLGGPASGPQIFLLRNGTYPYTIGAIAGWVTPDPGGSVSVNGSDLSLVVPWERTYGVSISESGLPRGEGWWLDVPKLAPSRLTPTPTLSLALPNGTYQYSASTVDMNYSAPSGSFTVSGEPTSVDVVFSRVTYTVTFVESGLPSGTSWEVSLNGSSMTGTSTLSFPDLPDGSYPFTVGSLVNPGLGGYVPSPAAGSISVNGGSVSQAIEFNETSSGPSSGSVPTIEVDAVLAGIAGAVLAVGVVAVLWSRRRKVEPAHPR
jgi:YVTN family beta-propeller protein